jgi:hypothetical protein
MSAKYPRTLHLPWSPGGTKDDKRMRDVNALLGMDIVLTEKLDGSNLCMTREEIFARSHSGAPKHPSFDQAKAFHAQIGWKLPSGHSLFGEWCYAVHSIEYTLPTYFHVFAIRDDVHKWWLRWHEVEDLCKSLGLTHVPVLEKTVARTEKKLQELTERHAHEPSVYGATREGVVVRQAVGWEDGDFPLLTGKWVRANHVQTDDHWKHQEIRKQRLAE